MTLSSLLTGRPPSTNGTATFPEPVRRLVVGPEYFLAHGKPKCVFCRVSCPMLAEGDVVRNRVLYREFRCQITGKTLLAPLVHRDDRPAPAGWHAPFKFGCKHCAYTGSLTLTRTGSPAGGTQRRDFSCPRCLASTAINFVWKAR